MEQALQRIREVVALYGVQLLAALAIFVIGWWIAKMLTRIVRGVMKRGNVDPALASFVSSLTYVALMVFVVIAALDNLAFRLFLS